MAFCFVLYSPLRTENCQEKTNLFLVLAPLAQSNGNIYLFPLHQKLPASKGGLRPPGSTSESATGTRQDCETRCVHGSSVWDACWPFVMAPATHSALHVEVIRVRKQVRFVRVKAERPLLSITWSRDTSRVNVMPGRGSACRGGQPVGVVVGGGEVLHEDDFVALGLKTKVRRQSQVFFLFHINANRCNKKKPIVLLAKLQKSLLWNVNTS